MKLGIATPVVTNVVGAPLEWERDATIEPSNEPSYDGEFYPSIHQSLQHYLKQLRALVELNGEGT